MALSSLALKISALLQGVPASHRTGFKTASKMGLFWGREFHTVPFNSIHSYLFGACEAWLACHVIWRRDVEPRILRISRMSEENPGFDRDDRSGDRFIISYYHFLSRGKMLMGRPKPFSNMHLRRAAGAHSGNGQGRGPRRGDFGSKRRARGQGFRFEFGRWLATSTERLRSLNTYGVRTARRIYKTKWSVGVDD